MKLIELFKYYKDKFSKRKKGLFKQRKSKKDYKYEEHFTISGSYEAKVDLRKHFKNIRNQRSTEACTGFAAAGIIEYLLETEFEKGWRQVSPLYNWYYGKVYHGWEDENKGVWLRNTLRALFNYGFVYNQTMPFITPYVRAPSNGENAIGEMTKTLYFNTDRFAYYLLQNNQEIIKDALSNKNPIVFGMYLNNSFYGNRDGEILDTKHNGSAHAMVIVGYDDEKEKYIVRNSWGSSWGDNGYCYIPYKYLENNSFDLWTIKRKLKHEAAKQDETGRNG